MRKIFKILVIALALLVGNVFLWTFMQDGLQRHCINKIEHGKSLNAYEVGSIYTIHLGVCFVGCFVAPEFTKESIQMLWKHEERVWHSDFFVREDLIRNRGRIGLPYTWKNLRIATALNGYVIRETPTTYYITDTIQYPYIHKSTSFFNLFYVNEGLFNYLQKIGLLHPYKFTYIAEK